MRNKNITDTKSTESLLKLVLPCFRRLKQHKMKTLFLFVFCALIVFVKARSYLEEAQLERELKELNEQNDLNDHGSGIAGPSDELQAAVKMFFEKCLKTGTSIWEGCAKSVMKDIGRKYHLRRSEKRCLWRSLHHCDESALKLEHCLFALSSCLQFK